jgi:hypothetical protein
MPGERSKKIGDIGEQTVGAYLRMIGWAHTQRGVDIPCIKPTKHQTSSSERKDHGVDYIFSYRCPLLDGVLQNVIISVKFTTAAYGNNPVTKFKDHFADLAHSLECFKQSPQRQQAAKGQTGINKVQDTGVIFWISNHPDTYDDVVAKLTNVILPTNCDMFESIYVVDNRRMAFGYSSLLFAEREFSPENVEFFYHDTGKNIDPMLALKSGKRMPVQFINSSVIAFRVSTKDKGNILLLTVDEPFSRDGLAQLIGLTQKLSNNWAARTLICFPDYSRLDHENVVQQVKASFSDEKATASLEVKSYSIDFLKLE